MGILKINTLGTSFTIKAKEDDKYLDKLLTYYNQITSQLEAQEILRDQKQIAILAGILLCDELYKEKENSFNLEHLLMQKEESLHAKNKFENNSSNNSTFQKKFSNDKPLDDEKKINDITNEIISKLERVL